MTPVTLYSCILKSSPVFHWRHSLHIEGENGRHSADSILECIFLNKNYCILIQISLKFIPKCPINNKPALVQIIGLVANRQKAIIWTNNGLVYWCWYWISWPQLMSTTFIFDYSLFFLKGRHLSMYWWLICGEIVSLIQTKLYLAIKRTYTGGTISHNMLRRIGGCEWWVWWHMLKCI